MEELVHR
jgi:hypothetical protein